MNKVLETYNKLPVQLKNVFKYAYSIVPLKMRLGKAFFRQLAFLEQSQWWSKQELENYQNEKLRKLIKHAYENVPYYQMIFKENKLTADDIKTIYDLNKLPILTKDMLRTHKDELRAVNFKDKDVVSISTSGTTGKPVVLYYDSKKEYLNFDPFVWRFFGWGGHKLGQLRGAFSRWLVKPKTVYTYNPVRNLIGLSSYKINKESINEYVEVLNKYKIEFIDGYPSMIELFTNLLIESRIKPPTTLKGIFSHSEHLYEWQRNNIEEYWGCKCFDWYGLEEKVIMGVECEQHSKLHLCSEFGITEFINSDHNGFKSIVATSLTNYAMPLIRYDTEDIGEPYEQPCFCGRGLPLFILKGGRKKEFVVTKNGTFISATTLEIANVSQNIKAFQYIQSEKGKLTLNIVKNNLFSKEDFEKIQGLLENRFDRNMNIEIIFVDSVKQTLAQKTPIIIQNINL